MTLGILQPLTEQEYLDLRYEFLKEIEEGGQENLNLYSDTDQLVSTGVGFNLTVDDVVLSILQTGFNLTETTGKSTYKTGKTEDGLVDAIISVTKGKKTFAQLPGIQTQLNALMVEYTTTKTEFKFESIGTKTAQGKIKDVFNELSKYFEGELNAFLERAGYNDGTADTTNAITNMAYSNERLALLSLAYGGPAKMLGSGLAAAFREDDRARAWFEIRYASNGDKTTGHAKRRYIESELFGLFTPAILADEGQREVAANKIIDLMEANFYPVSGTGGGVGYSTNLLQMIGYEKQYGSMVKAAQANIDEIEGLSLTVTPWGQVFKPIAAYLIDYYIKDEETGLSGKNYTFDGDVNLGLDSFGVLQSTDTSATGKDKDDLLVAVDDDIANYIVGGKGDDFLIGAAKDDQLHGGDDNDVLVGKAGADQLLGGLGNDVLIGGADNDTLNGGADTDKLEGGTGKDIYQFDGAFGRDIIEDADNDGQVVINGVVMGTFYQVDDADNIYVDNKNNPTFEIVRIQEGDTESLLVSPLNAGATAGSVLIKNWASGGLGNYINHQCTGSG